MNEILELLPATISHLQNGLKSPRKALQPRSRKLLDQMEKKSHAPKRKE